MQRLLPITLLALSSSSSSYSIAQAKPIFEEPVRIEVEGKPITIAYGYSFPSCIDLDKDGLKDIVVGEYRKAGELYFYKNIGTKNAPKYAKAKNLMIGDEILKVPGVGFWCTSSNPQFVNLDNDGVLDLFSGSYSCSAKQGRAPVQFFKGKKDSPLNFEKTIPVKTLSGALPDLNSFQDIMKLGSNRKLFYKPTPSRTKPNFVDLNGDGNLDLLYGETYGYFIKFNGTADKGINHFSNKAEILKDVEGNLLKVAYSSSPHFIDWDGDKDLDIVSGNGKGGIYYAENIGDPKNPKWQAFIEWLPPTVAKSTLRGRHSIQNTRHQLHPNIETTVYVTDYNNDGKLDILVGDKTILDSPLDGISDEQYAQKEIDYREMQDFYGPDKKAVKDYYSLQREKDESPEGKKALEESLTLVKTLQAEAYQKQNNFKDSFKKSEQVGFVWLYIQK